jgi:OTT_1508-like deaminase
MSANEPTSTNAKESAQESFTPLAEHLDADLPVTKISPTESSFPNSAAEEEFDKLCKRVKTHIQIIPKKDIVWNPNDPLHFFQSLAFVLRSEILTCVAVSSFTDILGATKLYIASNQTITESQQEDFTDIITSFLEMKPAKEIDAKVLPRQLSYITKQFDKISRAQVNAFVQEYPGELSSLVEDLIFKRGLTLEDILPLLKLIWAKRKDLRMMKAGTIENTTEATKRMAFHLCKMVRVLEEIDFVAKKVKLHQADASLTTLSKPFQFIENRDNCHAELAILKTAADCCESKNLYIGVSKRPCYCCSLLFKAVAECQSVKFNISIVTTHGKLYGKWNKIEGFLLNEFSQVWAKVAEKRAMIEDIQIVTDDNLLISGSISGEDNSRFD